ncbi:hypothetical protein COOONC_00562 [Cooperia oncophora]
MLETLNDWTRFIDNGDGVDVIYFDFSKAFDQVSHNASNSNIIQNAIDVVSAWSKRWGLPTELEKTSVLHLGPGHSSYTYHIDRTELRKAQEMSDCCCDVSIDVPTWVPAAIAFGISVVVAIAVIIAYILREMERYKVCCHPGKYISSRHVNFLAAYFKTEE